MRFYALVPVPTRSDFVHVEMEAASTVRDIKTALSEEHGEEHGIPPPEFFKLEFQGKVLEDDQLLNATDNHKELSKWCRPSGSSLSSRQLQQEKCYFDIIVGNAEAPCSHETAGSERSSAQESPAHATALLILALALTQVLSLPHNHHCHSRRAPHCFAVKPSVQLPVYFLPPLQRVVYPPHTSPVDA
jgi:hypothetical protein